MITRFNLAVVACVCCASAALGFAATQASSLSARVAGAAIVVGLVAVLTIRAGIRVRGLLAGILVLGHLTLGAFYARGLLPTSASLGLDAITFALLAVSWSETRRAGGWQTWVGLSVIFVGLNVAEAFNSNVPSLAYALQGARLLVMPVIAIIAFSRLALSRRELIFMSVMAMIGWLVNVEFALRQWLVGFSGQELAFVQQNASTYRVGSQIRLLGAMRSNQDFAFAAAVAVPLLAVALLHVSRGWRRVLLTVIFAASVAVLFGSLVRSGLVGGVGGAVLGAFVSATNASSRRRLAVGGTVIVLLLWAIATIGPAAILPADQGKALAERVTSIFNPSQDTSFNARQQQTWPVALALIRRHPLGAGPGSAGPLSQSASNAPLGAVTPDDGYLLIALQLGIPGVLLFIAMLLSLARELLRAARSGSAMSAAALGALVALAVGMTTSSFWDLTSPAALFAVLVGLGLRDAQSVRSPAPAPPSDTPAPAWLAPVPTVAPLR